MGTPETKNYIYYLSVKYNDCWKKVAFKDIVYLRSSGNYTEIHTRVAGKSYYTMKSLEQYEKELPPAFFRCHRSIVVNMAYIQHVNKTEIYLMNNVCLPVSKAKKLFLEEKLANLPALTVPFCNHCEHCQEKANCKIILPFVLEDKSAFQEPNSLVFHSSQKNGGFITFDT